MSKQPVNWEIIYRTARLTRKPATATRPWQLGLPRSHLKNRILVQNRGGGVFQTGGILKYFEDLKQDTNKEFGPKDIFEIASNKLRPDTIELTAAEIIRQRRSATAFDRNGSITREQFLSILDKTLPRPDCAPFGTDLGEPWLHLLLFVHQVENLTPGLYFFNRNPKALDSIKSLTRSEFEWEPIEENLPLFQLETGDFRHQAMMVSCHQDIAGDGAFSLGMIAAFKDPVTTNPFVYRQLFWESGMIGQVLYLAAEAHGVRGTGIGCFFDDAVHEILGLQGNQYQSLYHFTIGKPIEDLRLTTHPPYYHLKDR